MAVGSSRRPQAVESPLIGRHQQVIPELAHYIGELALPVEPQRDRPYGPGKHPHRTSGRTNMLSGINLQPGAWDPTRGHLDDVLISDVTMRNVQAPVHLSLKPGNTCGDVTVEGLSAPGVYGAAISAES